MLTVLRRRNFALVWIGALVSLTGDWAFVTGVPLVVYQMTGSTLALALAGMATAVPRLVLGSIAGVFVDRWDRRRTMLVADLVLGVSLLPLLLVTSSEWLWLIVVVLVLESAVFQFYRPAEGALVPTLVPQTDLGLPADAERHVEQPPDRRFIVRPNPLPCRGRLLKSWCHEQVEATRLLFEGGAHYPSANRATARRPWRQFPPARTLTIMAMELLWLTAISLIAALILYDARFFVLVRQDELTAAPIALLVATAAWRVQSFLGDRGGKVRLDLLE